LILYDLRLKCRTRRRLRYKRERDGRKEILLHLGSRVIICSTHPTTKRPLKLRKLLFSLPSTLSAREEA
jgi:hypothetical protein